ncbi:transposase (plasmid) [Mycobacterium avium subsp. hominissuis]|nr:transposase [Mycobacterium avium subsp. hominissuis]
MSALLRNVLAKVPKGSAEMVAAAIRTVFAQPDARARCANNSHQSPHAGRSSHKVETCLREAAADITRLRRLSGGPTGKRSGQPNPRGGRLNKEINAAADASRVPQPAPALLRLRSVLVEATRCRSPTSATSPRPASLCSTSVTKVPKPLPPQPLSRHSGYPTEPHADTRPLLHHSTGRDRGGDPASGARACDAGGRRSPRSIPDGRRY